MKINKAEEQLLSLIRGIGRSNRKVTKESISVAGKHHYKDNFSSLSSAYQSLIQKEFIKELNEEYSITNEAVKFLKKDSFIKFLSQKDGVTIVIFL